MSSESHNKPLPIQDLIKEINRTSAALAGESSLKGSDWNEEDVSEKELLQLANASTKLALAIEGPTSASWKIVHAVS